MVFKKKYSHTINHKFGEDFFLRSGEQSADIRLTRRLDETRVWRDVSSCIQRLESFCCRCFLRARDEEWWRLFRASYVIFPGLAACCNHQFRSVRRGINVHTFISIYINISVCAVRFIIWSAPNGPLVTRPHQRPKVETGDKAIAWTGLNGRHICSSAESIHAS